MSSATRFGGGITATGRKKLTCTGSGGLSSSPAGGIPASWRAPEVTAFLNDLVARAPCSGGHPESGPGGPAVPVQGGLAQPLPWLEGIEHAKQPVRRPTVLTASEAQQLLSRLHGTKWLMASLLYGAGLRLRECLTLRIKDVDFGYRQILVRDGKGGKDRVTMLPAAVVEPLQAHLVRVNALHERTSPTDTAMSSCPTQLRASTRAHRYEWGGSSSFRRTSVSVDPRTGVIRRTPCIRKLS